MEDLFSEIRRVILLNNAGEKCLATHRLCSTLSEFNIDHAKPVTEINKPGYPPNLKLVAPKELKRRGIQSQNGRNVLMHAIAHIEFNAINLALDAAYRFREQPNNYYQDWIQIADDEARHFQLIRDYLNSHDCDYSDYQAHNGLWDMALETQHDVVARMALVPRVLEARGLDVTPGMIKRLERAGDQEAASILEIIYQDEIEHVYTGSHWFFHHCKLRELEPRATFIKLVERHLHGDLRGPFNISARLRAGFDELELKQLTKRC